MGLLFGGTANDMGLDIKSNNMYQQSTDRMSTTPVPSNLKEYMDYQKNEHIPQWNNEGAFKFISNYLREGLPWYGNSYDQEANQKAIERMINERTFFEIQNLPLYSIYKKEKNNENK